MPRPSLADLLERTRFSRSSPPLADDVQHGERATINIAIERTHQITRSITQRQAKAPQ
jgi:hypothetical protein